MKMRCIVCGEKHANISLYRFPKEKNKANKWLAAVGLEHEILNQFSRICCQHFKTDDLLINGSLSANAIPSKEKLTSFKIVEYESQQTANGTSLLSSSSLINDSLSSKICLTTPQSTSKSLHIYNQQPPTIKFRQKSQQTADGSSLLNDPLSNFTTPQSDPFSEATSESSHIYDEQSIIKLEYDSTHYESSEDEIEYDVNEQLVVSSKNTQMTIKEALKSDNISSSSPQKGLLQLEIRTLKAKVQTLGRNHIANQKKIKVMHQKIRRQQKKINTMQSLINELSAKISVEQWQNLKKLAKTRVCHDLKQLI